MLLDVVGIGLVGVGVAELGLQEGVDLLGDRLDLDAGALDQSRRLWVGPGTKLTTSRI